MKNVLFATDLSARSDRACERAVALAGQHGARLVIVHIVDEEQPLAAIDHLADVARRAIEDGVAACAPGRTGGIDLEVRVQPGREAADILSQANEASAELIVLGTHRADSVAALFRGSTAERVIRESRMPVLLVKDRCRQPYRRVLVAVDFSAHSRRAIQMAVHLAPAAACHLLHVFHVPFSGLLAGRDNRKHAERQHHEQLDAMIEAELGAVFGAGGGPPSRFEKIIREGEILSAIREEVGRLEPDLLAVGTHGRTGIAHALLGSIAEDLLRDPPCDVLAVKAP